MADEEDVQKIIRENRKWLRESKERLEEQDRQRQILQRWMRLTHLIDVFENWDEFMEQGDLDQEWAHETVVTLLHEYKEELAAKDDYQQFQRKKKTRWK